MKIFKKAGSKVEQFFNWMNKVPETPAEGIAISMVGLIMFIGFFAIISLVGGFVGS